MGFNSMLTGMGAVVEVIAAAVLLLQVVVEIAEAVTPVVLHKAVTPVVERMLPRKVSSLLETPMVLRVLHMVAVTALRVLFPKLQRTVTLT